MDFLFKVDEAREEMRQAIEEVWSGLSKMGDVIYKVTNESSRTSDFNETYNPSLKMMHHCVTKFATEMDGLLDGIGRTQNAHLNILAKNARSAEELGDENEAYDGHDDDGSKYEVTEKKQYTYINHNGFNYRKHSIKPNAALGMPGGRYKCIGLACKCTGTVEPILQDNEVRIQNIDPHDCK